MHEGHRERLRERFIQEGLMNFEPHNVLELLLFYALPQKDTNEIAHRLIDIFGSLSEVLEAPVAELVKVEGIGKYSAVLLSMIPQLCNYYYRDRTTRNKVVGLDAINRFAANCFIGKTTEHVLLVCVDNKLSMINYHFISEGSVDSATVNQQKIIQYLTANNATGAIIAHNHPRGDKKPSRADLMMTMNLAKSLRTLRVKLHDHLIVSNDGYFSMASDPKKYGVYLNPPE